MRSGETSRITMAESAGAEREDHDSDLAGYHSVEDIARGERDRRTVSHDTIGTHDPYAALRIPAYRLFSVGRNLAGLGEAMQGVVIGWELYQRTGRPLTLAWVGLIQALPIFLFALHAGHIADTLSRKRIVVLSQTAVSGCSLALALLSFTQAGIPLFYLCLLCAATARAFGNPARMALLPQLVPGSLFGSAISWDTSIRRVAVISGAALGGWLLAWSRYPAHVYLMTAALGLAGALLLARLPDSARILRTGERATWKTLVAGIEYLLAHADHPGHDHARPVRGAAGRRDEPAADLCPRYPARRAGRAGMAARRALPRRAGDGAVPRASASVPVCGPRDALGGRRVRSRHHRLRPVPFHAAVSRRAVPHRGARHDQRGRAAGRWCRR